MARYLGLAILASVLMAFGLLLMKSRAEALPAARGLKAPRAILAWVRDPAWSGGLGLQTLGFALYVVALSGAPVSMVAVMMQGGIAMFVVLAVAILGERARPCEWAGIGAILIGMLMLALSLSAGENEGVRNGRVLASMSAGLAVAAALPMFAERLRSSGAAAAIFSGVAFGLGALFTKAMTDDFVARFSVSIVSRVAEDPYLYFTILVNVAGIVMLQNAFHAARGIVAMPLSSALANVVPIVGGVIAFGERVPAAPLAATLRVGSFVLTVAASALLVGSQDAAAAASAPAAVPKAS